MRPFRNSGFGTSLKPILIVFAVMCLFCLSACQTQTAPEPAEQEVVIPLLTGAEVLARDDFAMLSGKSVGLVVNHTARVDSMHLGDLVQQSSNVTLAAFFGPEHGIRGDADAGEEISDGLDVQTGVPVYSLYGQQKKPTQASLEGIDALLFDIQDIGARFYTYISTMGYAMQGAAEAGIPFYVLDRPNPLGDYTSGFVLDPAYESFVGLYPIPVAHGLTVGELAQMIQGEAMLPGLENLDLRIVEMEGWDRSDKWPALSRAWRPTSPNIPDFETAVIYVGTCFFEAVAASEGRGTRTPFKQVGASWIDETALVDSLNNFALPGVSFSGKVFTPESIAGMSSNPRFKGEAQRGVFIEVTDVQSFDPVRTGVHLLYAFYQQAPESEKQAFINERWMGLLAGTDRFQEQLASNMLPDEIIHSWAEELESFRLRRAPYLIYE